MCTASMLFALFIALVALHTSNPLSRAFMVLVLALYMAVIAWGEYTDYRRKKRADKAHMVSRKRRYRLEA